MLQYLTLQATKNLNMSALQQKYTMTCCCCRYQDVIKT